ncbi:hypothetical protein HSBAA_PA_0110 (plasmid) [Vreelandella sulfidaeris]|uniref:ATP-dependent RecD2 DNA helicase OB-fold domain-containing protein n=1 Tax=Vreelandella sulfidaeris TaxID=115553 RepID=A0A455UM49_9GAMM|nr:hypothetical protein HSBAA_PA_0110 [Halomonas sulfidaeris]
MSAAQRGESVQARGTWGTHPKFGKQFKADRLITQIPQESKALGAYLASGKVAGIALSSLRGWSPISVMGCATYSVTKRPYGLCQASVRRRQWG